MMQASRRWLPMRASFLASVASYCNHRGRAPRPGALLCCAYHPHGNICFLGEVPIISVEEILLSVLKVRTLQARPALDNIPEAWFLRTSFNLSQRLLLFPPRRVRNACLRGNGRPYCGCLKGLGIVMGGRALLIMMGLSSG